jgi:2,5-diketo-D-gluconate reductase A
MTTQTTSVPFVDLNDRNRMPQLGFGVFQVPAEETAEAVSHALKTGYRLVDTASAYGNEEGVREAIRDSGLERGEVFVTTKLINDEHGREGAQTGFSRSLSLLGGDYIDLYLIHWPLPERDQYVETWETLCALRETGLVRSVGVSNFQIPHLERIIEATGVVPAVNQIELHPRLQQPELRRFHAEHGIITEAWSPLGQGQLLDDPVIVEIASGHERTPAQVVLRWHIQLGNIVIPKSVTPSRIEENFQLFDFELTEAEMKRLAELDRGERTGPDPDTFS